MMDEVNTGMRGEYTLDGAFLGRGQFSKERMLVVEGVHVGVDGTRFWELMFFYV